MGNTYDTPAEVSLALGSAYFRNGNLGDAEREYKAAIAVNPKLGEAHNNLAVVYLLTDRASLAGDEIKVAEKAGFHVNPGLKQQVKEAAKAQLENGVITANDYLREVNAEDQARQSRITHQLQLLQAQINYQTISGKQ